MARLNYLRLLFKFAFKNNPLLYLSLFLSIVSVCLELVAMTALMPLANLSSDRPTSPEGFLIQALRQLGIPTDGRSILLVFILLFAARVLTQFASQGLTIYLGKRILLQLTTRAFSLLIRSVPIKELETKSIGYYISLAGDESARASNLIVFVSQFVATALLGVLYYAAIVAYSKTVGAAVFIFLFVTFFVLFESFRISHRLGIRQVDQSQTVNSFFVDAVNSLRSVRSYSAESYISESYFKQMLAYMRTLALIDITSMSARLGPVLFLFLCVAAAAMWPGTTKLSLDLPFIATIVILLMRFFPIVGQGLNLALRVIADARAGRDVTQVISEYEEMPKLGHPIVHINGAIEDIEANGVYFEHLDGKPVLRDFNAILRRGRSYAIIGTSGSGKSTFLDLLLGFHTPARGNILVNGISLNRLDASDLRGKAVLVAQDTAVFNDTLTNNLRLGFNASQLDLDQACRIACIDEFVSDLSSGYETLLNYRGTNFSGGQKQRIGIARAVLRRPDVLLLDESTSALDAGTRERVVDNLLEEFKDRIVVFVTHDAFVMSKVDEVLDLSPQQDAMASGIVPSTV